MKFKANIFLISALFLTLIGFVSCKNKDIDIDSFKFEYQEAKPSADSVSFLGSYSFSGNVDSIMVNIGEREDLADAKSYRVQIEETDFSGTVEGLKPSTTYYYNYTIYFGACNTCIYPTDEVYHFITARVPKVGILQVLPINNDSTSIRVDCVVLDANGSMVTERGICWNNYGNPNMGDSILQDTIGGWGTYSIKMEHLVPGKTYHIRAYAKNAAGTGFSPSPPWSFETPTSTEELLNIEVRWYPDNGGIAYGGGSFHYGDTITLKAEPNDGYKFAGWDDGNTNNPREVIVTVNATYKAIFSEISADSYNVTTHADPEDGGNVDGGGTYVEGEQIQLSASANPGYTFKHWNDGNRDNPRPITVNANMEFTAFFKKTHTVTVHANDGGTAYICNMTGTTATFEHGDTCCVYATPNPGYGFKSWTKTEDNTEVSIDSVYNFPVTDDCNLVANFTQVYTLDVIAEPPEGGTVSGGGHNYHYGDMATLKAIPYTGYDFLRWNDGNTDSIYRVRVTESASYTAYFKLQDENTVNVSITVSLQDGNSPEGTTVSFLNHNTQAQQDLVLDMTGYLMLDDFPAGNYRITVTKNGYEPIVENKNIEHNITLNYDLRPITIVAPTGAINGKFTINGNGNKVYFSEGNLQYKASDDKWRFAENQYEYIGNGNNGIGQYYSGWIDLYGWATSGWDCNNTYYHPWDSYNNNGSLYGPPGDYDLLENNSNSDWGIYNTIYSGPTATTGWRTLTILEWKYVFEQRNTISGKHYAKAQITGTNGTINGVILLPDDWNMDYYNLSSCDNKLANYSSNPINSTVWSRDLEAHGAVFLPAAGGRGGNTVNDVGNSGSYWSTSSSSNNNAYYVFFNDGNLNTGANNGGRCFGRSVRLVRPVEN